MAKNLRDISIASFFFVLAGFFVVGIVLGKDAYTDWKNQMTSQVEMQRETVNFIKEFATRGYDDFSQARKSELEHIKNLTNKAEKSGQFIEELSILIAARMLEEQRTLPASTADQFVREAIQSIKGDHSERVGKILEAMNDKFLRDRM